MAAGHPLPERLKAARLRIGLSQKALGMAAGLDEFVASSRINQYERGTHAPNYLTSQQLARVLDVPTAYLYADSDADADLLLAARELNAKDRRALLAQAKSRKP